MSTNPRGRAWVEVRADALRQNFARIREGAGRDARVLPMVKADAYGLGVAEVVRTLEPEHPWGYGVATVAEGLGLRRLGVERPVLVCSPAPPGEVDAAVEHGLHLSVSSQEALRAARAAAERAGIAARVHVDVDTGMGRSGFDWRSAAEWVPAVVAATGDGRVEWVGCHTHLHSADERPASIDDQWDRMTTVLGAVVPPAPGLMVHVLNSAGVFRAPERAHALVRPGIFLYGGEVGEGQPKPQPVVSVRARVVHVRTAAEGSTLGYGATYRARGPERWATLAIGYGDGIPRALGNRGAALIAGRRVPVIGRISMDLTVVHITDLPDVEVGDVATLLGADGDEAITVDEVAREAGTISYEILTGLTRRLPRIWIGLDG